MKPHIDPKVDCVFKAMLGSEEHKPLLVHFLNAVLQADPPTPIQDVEILNPYNERESLSDKLSVVDVKACDAQGRSYQIEIQLAVHPGLSERMLYTWSTIYHSLIGKGDEFIKLRPVVAIWLLNESLFPDRQAWHLSFAVMDRNHGVTLSDHLQIHLLQLPDWQVSEDVHEELDRWMYLFKEGEDLDVEALPAILETEEMRQAMQVLQHFSENERAYLMYQQRLESEMVQASWLNEIQRATARAEQATRQAEQATRRAELAARQAELATQQAERERQAREEAIRQAEQAARQAELATQQAERERQAREEAIRQAEWERQEKEKLLALLKQAGIDPMTGQQK